MTGWQRRWQVWLWLLLAPVILASLILSVVLRTGGSP
jgi:hypothetical protein